MTNSKLRSSLFVDQTIKQPLLDFLTRHDLIGREREAHFVVAYSGGRDSTALLHSLAKIQAESEASIKITAAYYWHPWRPLQDDLQVVHQNCKQLNIQWVMITPNLTLPKSETAARQDRYDQLARLVKDLDATAVLTAHHQDDHVETVLFRILRGTGIEGIIGIPELRLLPVDSHQDVTLARPLLNQSRDEINAYIQAHQLKYVEDPTNTDTRMKRNLIRHELLPKIEQAFPHVRQSLMQLAELTAGEVEIIDTKMASIWREIYNAETKSLDEVRFSQLSIPFQRRVMRQFLEAHEQETGHKKVEDIIAFISGQGRELYKPALYSLSKNTFMMLYKNLITVEIPKKEDIPSVNVTIPGQVSHLGLKTTVTITPLTAEQRLKPIDFSKQKDNEAYVDLSKFDGQELTIRTRQEGDKIKPLGMDSPIKLKRLFINRAIPRFQRDSIPLLASNEEVLWAVGVGLSDKIRVKDKPTHLIKIVRGSQA